MRITCPNCRKSATVTTRNQLSETEKGQISDLFQVEIVCNHCSSVGRTKPIETVLHYVPNPVHNLPAADNAA